MLEEGGATVDYHDPFIPAVLPMRHFPKIAGRASVELTAAGIVSYDAVLIITDHDSLPYDLIAKNGRIVVDTRNAMKGQTIDAARLFKA